MEITDWEYFGSGMEDTCFVSKSHPELLLKVHNFNNSKALVEREFKLADDIQRCGIACPRTVGVIDFEGKPGIVTQRVQNKKSFCRLAGEHPELIPNLAKRLALMARDLHSKTAEGCSFPEALPDYRKLLECNTILDEATKSRIQEAIDAVATDDRHTLLHGDLHFGNIITDGEKDYFIDLGSISSGNPNFDLAMFYIVTHYGCEESMDFLYHLSWKQAIDFWNVFKLHYYGRFRPDEDILKELKNYMLIRTIWFKVPEIQQKLSELLSREIVPTLCEVVITMPK